MVEFKLIGILFRWRLKFYKRILENMIGMNKKDERLDKKKV